MARLFMVKRMKMSSFRGRNNTTTWQLQRPGEYSQYFADPLGENLNVNYALELLMKVRGLCAARIDVFNCCTEERSYSSYLINRVLLTTASRLEEWGAWMKKHIGPMGPRISFGEGSQSYEETFGLDFKEVQYSEDEILDLSQRIAE